MVLDTRRMSLGPDGLDGFWWPVSLDEVRTFRDRCVRQLVAEAQMDDKQGTLLSVTLPRLLLEGMGLHQWTEVARRAQEVGREVEPPSGARLLPNLLRGEAPESPPFLDLVRRGLRVARPWVPRLLRQARWSPHLNGADPRGMLPLDGDRDTVALDATGLVAVHARRVDRPVKYRPLSDCFPPVEEPEPPADGGLAEPILSSLEAGFDAVDAELPAYLEDYVRGWSGHLEALVDARLQAPATRENLGRELWTAGGTIWDRILARLVHEDGGTVVNHDHATGEGHLRSFSKPVGDLGFCDRFVTFNEAQAEGLRESADPDLVAGPLPEIVPVPAGRASQDRSPPSGFPRSDRVRRVVVVTTMYEGERIHGTPHMADPQAADWHARLLHRLDGMGYEVHLKPHPRGQAPQPPVTRSVGVEEISGSFERALEIADVLVFDYPMTTTFGTAIRAGAPMVLIDFGYAPFREKARELIRRRLPLVEGRFDEDNRAHVDWDVLEEAIRAAPDRDDPAFAETYLEIR